MLMYRGRNAILELFSRVNSVSVEQLRSYVKKHHPRQDFDRNISIIRDYQKSGTIFCAKKYGFDNGRPLQLLKQYAGYAAEIERGGIDGRCEVDQDHNRYFR